MNETIRCQADREHREAVELCMAQPDPLRYALEKAFKAYDDLGVYKDDDFGDFQGVFEVAREVMKKTGERA